MVQRVAKSRTRLKQPSVHRVTEIFCLGPWPRVLPSPLSPWEAGKSVFLKAVCPALMHCLFP